MTAYNSWTSVAMSADGSVIAAVADNSYIYVKYTVWTKYTMTGEGASLQRPWKSVSLSADGTKLIAGASNSSTQSYLVYNSSVGTGSFHNYSDVSFYAYWSAVALSPDGSTIVGGTDDVSNGGYVYTAPFSGGSTTTRYPAGASVQKHWKAAAISQDGLRMVVAASSDYVYTSTNGGVSWTKETTAGPGGAQSWSSLASSYDGGRLAATINGGGIFTTIPGVRGPAGYQGYQGYQGYIGPQGYQGNDGPQGPQGDNGSPGSQGYQGYQGYQGNDGTTGKINVIYTQNYTTYYVPNYGCVSNGQSFVYNGHLICCNYVYIRLPYVNGSYGEISLMPQYPNSAYTCMIVQYKNSCGNYDSILCGVLHSAKYVVVCSKLYVNGTTQSPCVPLSSTNYVLNTTGS
jgi:hypothetical protein